MRGVYTITASIASVTAAKTLIQIASGAGTSIEILRAWVTQSSVTADDTMELQLLRKSAAATVTLATPVAIDASDQAAKAIGGTALTGVDASSEGTDGALLVREGASVLAGWVYLPTPEERITVGAGELIALKSAIAITSATIVCGMTFREIG